VNLVDANVLLYAVNQDEQHHQSSRAWLDGALSGQDTVAFAWIALLAFLRLSTKPALFPAPLSTADALDVMDSWLRAPASVVLVPGRAHSGILRDLLRDPTGGNVVNDAHLAALAIEHGCGIVSFDRDFDHFPGIERLQPH
jgi:toxin-antitoxin system PIN domain toxin